VKQTDTVPARRDRPPGPPEHPARPSAPPSTAPTPGMAADFRRMPPMPRRLESGPDHSGPRDGL